MCLSGGMDGRGGCCIARYTDMSKMGRIMMKFRPIAPKPAADGSVSGAGSTVPENKKGSRKVARRKRRFVRDIESNGKTASGGCSNNKRSCKKRKVAPAKSPATEEENESTGKTESGGSSSVSNVERETIVTLPLLPEKPERKESPATAMESTNLKRQEQKKDLIWLSFGNQLQQPREASGSHVTGHVRYGGVVPVETRVVGSWVRVESVTGTWVNGYGLGRTDKEKMMNLERDTCPGFISNGQKRVRWVNGAYRDLVGQSGGGEVVVWVVMGDGVRLPPISTAAFTCRVRVVTCGKENSSRVLLCDVWRMEGGGHAWRLDTEASLSL